MRTLQIGNIFLICCCISYLIFWSLGYRPGMESERTAPLTIVFFLITAVLGVSGIGETIVGLNILPKTTKTPISSTLLIAAGIVLYIGLCFITGKQFHRPVTTELLLITGWLILEACTINTLAASGEPAGHLIAITMLTLAAWIVSMVLYMLYYKMEPAKAYYAAMVPLIAIGISMTGSLFIISF